MLINYLRSLLLCVAVWAIHLPAMAQSAPGNDEMYRPRIHFSPKAHWTNDPNGMVYNQGVYHLFFQYHPYSSVWGPMHWGHASSTNLIDWKEQAVALYPDSLGMIFSGSAVVDKNNTAGFAKAGQTPLIAIFTQHDDKAEKKGSNHFQNQGLAYSLDNGKTWTKYKGNPVLRSPDLRDFRDPKVSWHEGTRRWIMTLAAGDRIIFYSSPDLKHWKKETSFGENLGAHGGVWECPDLFTLDDKGKKTWVLIVNINPGGPNKGSATQYFLGDFDGHAFSPRGNGVKWLDYGPDEYAGITWSNTGNRRIFLGWMSNWLYANQVPTTTWRNAMTIPRELKIVHAGNETLIASEPVTELAAAEEKALVSDNFRGESLKGLRGSDQKNLFPCRLKLTTDQVKDFSVTLSNGKGEKLVIGFDQHENAYFIDRTKSGQSDFSKDFSAIARAPRFSTGAKIDLTLVIDVASVELFADGGLTTMTSIFFPSEQYNDIQLSNAGGAAFKELSFAHYKVAN